MSGVSTAAAVGIRKPGFGESVDTLGRGVELQSLLTCRPRSRQISGELCDIFDSHFSVWSSAAIDFGLNSKMLKYASLKLEAHVGVKLVRDIEFLARDLVTRYVHDDRYGRTLSDVAALCHCRISPHMVALGAIEGNDIEDVIIASLYEMPCEERPDARAFSYGDTRVYVRDVGDIDRGSTLLGPLISVDGPAATKYAAVDFNSHAAYESELILLGGLEEFTADIGGELYISYVHPDTPASKTLISHYRMCCVYDSTMYDGRVYPIPPLAGKLLKMANRGCNVMLHLPRAVDLQRLIATRPWLGPIIRYLLWGILNGHTLSLDPPSYMVSESERIDITPDTVFSAEYYKITAWTESNHGDWRWNAAYSRAFA
jgi:hypothetical protein